MQTITTAEELGLRLLAMQRRWKRLQFARGLVRTLALTAAVVLAGCLVDYFVEMNLLFRWLLTGIIYLSISVYAYQSWLKPIFAKDNFLRVAWLLERSCPELNEKLISAIELDASANDAVSAEMVAAILAEANFDLGQISPTQAFPFSWRRYRMPLGVLAGFAIALCIPHLQLRELVSRTTLPSRRDPGVGSFRLALLGPQRLEFIEGESVSFVVKSSRPDIPRVSLFLRNTEGHVQRVDMKPDREAGTHTYKLSNVYDDLEFWAKAGKVSTRVVDLDVVKRPKIEYFEITSTPPAYAGISTSTIKATAGDLRVLKNTNINLIVHATKPLSAAELVMGERKIPLRVDGTRKRARCSFPVTESASYQVFLRDLNGLGNPGKLVYEITAIADERPKVILRNPTHDLYLNGDDTVRLEWFVNDDYGIARQELRYQVNAQPFQGVSIPVGANVFYLELARLGLEPGDEVELLFRVTDEADQAAETPPRRLTVITGRGLRGANQFVAYVEKARAQLLKASNLLSDIQAGLDTAQSGQTGHTGHGAELEHSMNMLTHRVNELDRQMLQIQHTCGDIRDHGFFPMSHAPPELLRLALRHDRVFRLQGLLDTTPNANTTAVLRQRFARFDQLLIDLDGRSRKVITAAVGENLLRNLEQIAAQDPVQPRLVARARETAVSVIRMSGIKTPILDEILKIEPAKDPRGDALRKAFQNFRRQNKKGTANHREAARHLSRIARELPLLETAFAETIRNLEIYDSSKDWQVARSIATDFRARPSPLADQLADNRLMADVLSAGIKGRSLKHLRQVNAAMAAARNYHDLIRFEPFLEGFAETLSRNEERLRGASNDTNPREERFKKLAARIAQEQSWQVEILLGFPFRNHTLEDHAPLRAMVRQLNAAQGHFTSFSNLARTGDIPKARQYFVQGVTAARLAQRQLQTQITAAQDARELARKALGKMVKPRSEQLNDVVATIAELADADHDLVVGDQQQIDSLQLALNRTARNLEQEALGEIAQSSGKIRAAMAKLAIAVELDSLRRQQMQSARSALVAVELDVQREENEDPLEPARGEAWRLEQMALVREELQLASEEAVVAVRLLRQAEAANGGELSRRALARHHQEVEALAANHLTTTLLGDLKTLQVIRQDGSRADRLAELIQTLRDNAPNATLTKLRQDGDRLGRGIHAVARSDKSGQFRHLAQAQISRARASVSDLLQQVRNLRADLFQQLKPESRKTHIVRLRDHPRALEQELIRAEGYRHLFEREDREATVLFQREILPPIRRATNLLQNNQSPGGDAGRAIAGLKKLDRLLQNYAVDVANASLDLKDAEALPGVSPVLRAQLQSELEGIKHRLMAAEIATQSMVALRKKIAEEQNRSRKLLDSLQLEKVDPRRRRMIEQQRRLFGSTTPLHQAAILNGISAILAAQKIQVPGFRERARALRNLYPSHTRVVALSMATKQVASNGAAATQRILRYFDQLEDSDLADSSRALANHLLDNLKLADFGAARKNLIALVENVGDISVRQPTVVPLPSPEDLMAARWRVPLPTATLAEMDWNARRALNRILATDNSSAALAPLLTGNYGLAAATTGIQAAKSDLQIAAARRRRLGNRRSTATLPLRFQFPNPSPRDSDAARLMRQAQTQPVTFLAGLDQQLDKARKTVAGVKKAAAAKNLANIKRQVTALAEVVSRIESARRIVGCDEHPVFVIVNGPLRDSASAPWSEKSATLIGASIDAIDRQLDLYAGSVASRRKLLIQQMRIEEMSRRVVALASRTSGDGKKADTAAARDLLQNLTSPLKEALSEDLRHTSMTAAKVLAEILRRAAAGDYDIRDRRLDLLRHTEASGLNVSVLPLRGDAFRASATANLLGNREALHRAQQGDLSGAAISMRDLAGSLPEGQRGLCEAAAARYEAAHQRSREDLLDELLVVVEEIMVIRDSVDRPLSDMVRQFENRACQNDFTAAANILMRAVAIAPENTGQTIKGWSTSLQQTADWHSRRLETVTDENRAVLAELREWERHVDAATLPDFDKAVDHILDGNASEAAKQLRRTAQGLPSTRADELLRLARRLDRPAPRLGPGDFAELDWNARLGVMKAMAYPSDERDEAMREALRENYDQAAELAQGPAQSDFMNAAKNQLARREEKIEIPKAFIQPRVALDPLQMERLRRQLASGRVYFLKQTIAGIKAATKTVQEALKHARGKRIREATAEIRKLRGPLSQIEARRHLLGESDHTLEASRVAAQVPAARKKRDFGTVQKNLSSLQQRLARLETELQAESIAAESRMVILQLLDRVSAAITVSTPDAKQMTAGVQAAERLRDRLKGEGTVVARRASALANAVASSLKRKELASALANMKDLRQAIAAMDTSRPRSVAMNREAYDASAKAAVIGNRNALDHARAGNYEKAEESMRKLAKALPEGRTRDLVLRAATRFAEAGEAQCEMIRSDLEQTIRHVPMVSPKLPAQAAKPLSDAALAVRNSDLVRAVGHLHLARKLSKGREAAFLQNFDRQLQQVLAEAIAAEPALPFTAQDAMRTIRDLTALTADLPAGHSEAPLAELSRARQAVIERDYVRGARHLRYAAEALAPSPRRQAQTTAASLSALDWRVYGTMNRPARDAVRQLRKPSAATTASARKRDYDEAARLAKRSRDGVAYALFQEAARQAAQVSSLYRMEAQSLLSQAVKLSSGNRQKQFAAAANHMAEGRLLEAYHLARRVSRASGAEVMLTGLLARAQADEQTRVDPLLAAAELAANGRFGEAAVAAASAGDDGQALRTRLDSLERKLDDAIGRALELTTEKGKVDLRSELAAIIASATRNDFAAAAARARRLRGADGPRLAEDFSAAAERGGELVKELRQAAAQARGRNQPATAATDWVSRRLTAVRKSIFEARADVARHEAAASDIDRAKGSVKDHDFASAAEILANLQVGTTAAELLEQADEERAEGYELALDAASEVSDEKQKNALLDATDTSDPARAERFAAMAGKSGEPARKLFATARETAARGLVTAQLAGKLASTALAKEKATVLRLEKKQVELEQLRDMLKNGSLGEATGHANKMADGAYQASLAADYLVRILAVPERKDGDVNTRPRETDPGRQVQQRVGRDLIQALADLQNARDVLTPGVDLVHARDSINRVADGLSAAGRRLALSASQQAAVRMAESSGQILIPDGGQIPDDPSLAAWSDPGQDARTASSRAYYSRYSPYYRKLNQKYLEWVARESRKWQSAPEDER